MVAPDGSLLVDNGAGRPPEGRLSAAINPPLRRLERVINNLARRTGFTPTNTPQDELPRGGMEFRLHDNTSPGTTLHTREENPIQVIINGQPIDITDITIQRVTAADALGVAGARLVEVRHDRSGAVHYTNLSHNPNESIRLNPDRHYAVAIPVGNNRIQYIPMESFQPLPGAPEPVPTPAPVDTLPAPAITPAPTPAPTETHAPAVPTTPREQLEARNLVIAGVKTKERRVFDLVNKAMERAKGLGRQAFKEVFEHKLGKYYSELLDTAQSPFAEEAIRLAEQKAEQRYTAEQQGRNFLFRKAREVWEGIKAVTFGRTQIQEWTIQELTNTQNTEVQEALARGKQMYLDEKGDFAGRFDTAFDRQDLAIRHDMGEGFTRLDATNPFSQEIKTLIKQFTHGDIDEATFAANKDALWERIKTANPDLLKDAEDYADTLTAVGKQYKEQWNRAASDAEGRNRIDSEIEAMRVALGIGQMGEATSMNKSDTQNWTGKLKEFSDFLVRKNIIGASLFNEATVGTAVSYALSVKSMGSMFVTSGARAVGGLLGGGVAAGIFGAVREKGRLTKEYWSYLGEREAGVQTVAGSKKREWFDQMDVTRRKSDELTASLRANLYDVSGALKTNLTDDEIRATLGQLADAKARWTLSSRKEKRVSLIEIGGLGGQEQNRTKLIRTIDQVEKDLGRYVGSHADVKARLMAGHEYDAFVWGLTTTQTQILEKGKDTFTALQQDSAQRLALTQVAGYAPEIDKLRKNILGLWGERHSEGTVSGLEATLKEFNTQANIEAARVGIKTAGIGMAIGALTQEAIMDWKFAQANGWQGFGTLGHGGVVTGIKEVFGWGDGASALSASPVLIDGNFVQHSQNLHFDPQGNIDLINPDGTILQENVIPVGDLSFNPDGTFSQHTTDYLAAHNFNFTIDSDALHPAHEAGTHDLFFGTDKVTVPKDLHWVDNGDGTSRLVLNVTDGSNNFEQVIHERSTLFHGSPDDLPDVIRDLHNNPLIDMTGGADVLNGVSQTIDIPGIPRVPLPDGTDHTLTAVLPQGTQLIETSHGIYDLVDASNTSHTLASGIHIDDTGLVTNASAINTSALALENHIQIANTDIHLDGGGEGASGFFPKPVIEMGQERGFHGIWGWVEEPVNTTNIVHDPFNPAQDVTLTNKIPLTNYVKHMARTLYEKDFSDIPSLRDAHLVRADGSIMPYTDIDARTYTMMYEGDTFQHLPTVMFDDQGVVKLGAIAQKAINMVEHQGVNFETATPGSLGISAEEFGILKSAYRIGRVGSEATKEEFLALYKFLSGAGTQGIDLHHPLITEQLSISTLESAPNNLISTPLAEVPQIPIPIIPIVGRRGLESGTPARVTPVTPPVHTPPVPPVPVVPTPVYPYGQLYRPEIPPEERERYEEEVRRLISPRFEGNPDYVPDASYEIPRYLNMQRQDIEYWSQLEALDQQVLSPMHADTKAVVSLAVAGHQEYENIYRTLETLSVQVDKNGESIWKDNNFEVNLLVNWPNGTSPAKTMDEIQRFRLAHPDVKVNAYTFLVTNGKKELGLYKKMIFDLALLRASKRPGPIQDVAVIMNDADMVYSNPRYLDGMLNMIQDPNNAKYDAVLGRQDLNPETYNNYPTFHASMRLWHVLESVRRAKRDIIGTQGRNTIMRASSYAAIGGHRTKDFWSDVELGWILNTARNGKNSIQYSNANWVMVDPRRELSKFLNGEPVATTWFDFNSRDVRGTKVDFGQYKDVDVNALNSSDLTNPEIVRFDKRLQDEYQAIIDVVTPWFGPNLELQTAYSQALGSETTLTTKEIVEKTLGLLNVNATVTELTEEGRKRYTIEFKKQVDSNGKIIATGTEGLRHDLKVYKDKQQWKTKIRSNPLLTSESSLPATLEPQTSVIKGTPFTVEYKDKFELDYVVKEVFEAKEYTWKPESAKPRIIDVGSHIGLSVLYWKSLAPQARITAIEPNPDTATLLKKNVQRNQLKGVRVIQAAASTQAGTTTLYMPKQGVGHRVEDFISSEPKDQSLYDRVTVPTIKLSEMITEPVDLLKIDAEGAELIILRDIEMKLPMVKEINMEFHAGPNMPKAMFDEACEILRKKGFKLTILGQWGKPLDPEEIDYTNRVNIILTARRKKTPMRGGPPNRKK